MIQRCRVCGVIAGGLVVSDPMYGHQSIQSWPEPDLCPQCPPGPDKELEELTATITEAAQHKGRIHLMYPNRFECCQKCRIARRLPATGIVGYGGPYKCPLCGAEYTPQNGCSSWLDGEPKPLPDPIEPLREGQRQNPMFVANKINEIIARLNEICAKLGMTWSKE